uniref:Adiponectin receptor protein n=1 Tax=Rhabditophanes sp. KR3021 TaxID=114890 RepID=A0AC35U729_9BILA
MSSLTDILKDAKPNECDKLLEEDIVADDKCTRKLSEFHLPIDIVVQSITAAVHLPDSDEEDGEIAISALNYQLEKKGFKVTRKDNGADLEITTQIDENDGVDISKRKKKSIVMFKKGHRRAWSMPYNNKEKNVVAVVNDDEYVMDNKSKKHIIKYRLHPKADTGSKQAINGEFDLSELPELQDFHLPPTSDFSKELNVDLDENEVLYYTEERTGITKTKTVVKKLWEPLVTQDFELLPEWLQDNKFLRTGHRPPLPSFSACLKSIFDLHTETGNIWTHMYGCVFFVGLAIWFLTRPENLMPETEKIVFSCFFIGAICCLGLSFAFHTVVCHSIAIGKLFSKLDYTGISLLIIGSFVPWIYYSFYCRKLPTIIYISMITILGISAVIVSLWDKFAEPAFRPIRAAVFMAMGLSSVVPVIHLLVTDGFTRMIDHLSFHWLLIMGFCYLFGATLYATRTPERFFPGKCDIWFQSHQMFHLFVDLAAIIHFYGIVVMAKSFLEKGSCREQLTEQFGIEYQTSALDHYFGIY